MCVLMSPLWTPSPGSAHHGAVWAGQVWEEPWHHVQFLEFLLRWPDEYGPKTGQRQIRQQVQVSGYKTLKLHATNTDINQLAGLNLSYYWSYICTCLLVIRKWSWTSAWNEQKVRTTGTSVCRSRAPASRGWCGSTGELCGGFWPVREEHGPTSMTSSDFFF